MNIARKLQRIFGGNFIGAPSGKLLQIGSAATTPAYSDDPDTLQSLPAYLNAFGGIVVGKHSPSMQDMNSLLYLCTRQLAYVLQKGVPEYLDTEEYQQNSWCQYGGTIYRCKTDATVGYAPTDATKWESLASILGTTMPGAAKAFVTFDASGSVTSSFNVSGVTKTATGNFTIAIAAGVMPDANYSWTASNTQDDTGGNSVIAGRYPGDARTATSFQVRTFRATDQLLVDEPETTVIFYHS